MATSTTESESSFVAAVASDFQTPAFAGVFCAQFTAVWLAIAHRPQGALPWCLWARTAANPGKMFMTNSFWAMQSEMVSMVTKAMCSSLV